MKRMNIKPSEPRVNLQIGAGFDIPNATFVTGRKGETLTTGAVMNSVGVLGPADSYKSTTLYYIALTIIDRYGDDEKYVTHYDTEVNTSPDRINQFAKKYDNLPTPLISANPNEDNNIWVLSDKSQYYADGWVPILREFIEDRAKDKRRVYEAYSTEDRELKILTPTVGLIDSMSMFEPSSTVEMLEKQKKEDGKANTYYMKQGGYKDKFVSEIPVLTNKANFKLLMSAHIGKKIDMNAQPHAPKDTKQMGFLKQDEYVKGVSPKFMYLTTTIWYNHTGRVLKNQTTKLPEYPAGKNMSEQETDLMLVRSQPMKSKAGAIGYTLPLIFSQKEGLLPHLSAFHYIKTNDKFGIVGNDRNYALCLLPDVKLSRTTVRGKINASYKLRRALEILRDLHQLKVFHPHFITLGLWLEPQELYDALIAKGYNWDDLLDTIDYPPIDSYNPKYKPHISIVDLLNMAADRYTPYWMEVSKDV